MSAVKPKKRQIKMGAISYAKMAALMLDGVYTCQELADETGLSYVTVLQYTRELHLAGAAHVSGWEKDALGRDTVRIYGLGRGKDAPKEKKSAAARNASLRAKRGMQKISLALVGTHA